MISRRSILSAVAALPLFGYVTTAKAQADGTQPKMHAAIKSLQNAKEHLDDATQDKGGHKGKAKKFIDQAIAEVQKGINYDRTHGNDKAKTR
jgi:hypothetical protein